MRATRTRSLPRASPSSRTGGGLSSDCEKNQKKSSSSWSQTRCRRRRLLRDRRRARDRASTLCVRLCLLCAQPLQRSLVPIDGGERCFSVPHARGGGKWAVNSTCARADGVVLHAARRPNDQFQSARRRAHEAQRRRARGLWRRQRPRQPSPRPPSPPPRPSPSTSARRAPRAASSRGARAGSRSRE